MHLILTSISVYLLLIALMGLREKFHTAKLCHSVPLLQAMVYFFQMEISVACESSNSGNGNGLIRYYTA